MKQGYNSMHLLKIKFTSLFYKKISSEAGFEEFILFIKNIELFLKYKELAILTWNVQIKTIKLFGYKYLQSICNKILSFADSWNHLHAHSHVETITEFIRLTLGVMVYLTASTLWICQSYSQNITTAATPWTGHW